VRAPAPSGAKGEGRGQPVDRRTPVLSSRRHLPWSFLTSDRPKALEFNKIGFALYALSNPFMSRMAAGDAAVVTGNANS
jgi:hypothetical protein